MTEPKLTARDHGLARWAVGGSGDGVAPDVTERVARAVARGRDEGRADLRMLEAKLARWKPIVRAAVRWMIDGLSADEDALVDAIDALSEQERSEILEGETDG